MGRKEQRCTVSGFLGGFAPCVVQEKSLILFMYFNLRTLYVLKQVLFQLVLLPACTVHLFVGIKLTSGTKETQSS